MHPPLTELNQCAFAISLILMLAALQTTGMYYFVGICIKRTKPHFSTPFFVSVWYKGLIVQFGQKAEISEKIQIVLLPHTIFIAF